MAHDSTRSPLPPANDPEYPAAGGVLPVPYLNRSEVPAMKDRRAYASQESRVEELRRLARSTDDAERRVAARLLREIDAEVQARIQAVQGRKEAA